MVMSSDYRRCNSADRDRECWFTLELSNSLLQGNTFSETVKLYDDFGKWFEKECDGTWAYPAPNILLFSDEEDKVKVVLKFL